MWNTLLDLFLPPICPICERTLHSWEQPFCLGCTLNLPETRFHLWPNNSMQQQLELLIPVFRSTSLFFFEHGNRTAHLIHQMKYNNQKYISDYCGIRLGETLKKIPDFQSIDLVVPVPLHPKRFRKRGYNQVFGFASQLADQLKADYCPDFILRNKHTPHLAQASAKQRKQWIKDAFILSDQSNYLNPKHLLLVDDVMTTGATLAACGASILNSESRRLSVATIGCRLS